MLYIATARLWYVAAGLVLFVAGGALASREISHVHDRITIWLHPWTDGKVFCPSTEGSRCGRTARATSS
jgi:cell division protein FtsW (lipid II flippase)